MQSSYADLIQEHGHIERQAELLLAEAMNPAASAAALAQQMQDLATFVRDHIHVEAQLVDLCDEKPLPTPWRAAFVEGRDAFLRLCRDWLAYIERWTVAAIAADRARFRVETREILGRLIARLAIETRGLYAVALQTGAITFR